MIFWLVLILFVVFVVSGIVTDWDTDWDYYLSMFGSVILGATTIIMLAVICVNCISAKAWVAENRVRYESLVYQYQNNFYDNENEVGKYQLISDICHWNEDLSKYKTLQRDFWVGIFYPNIFDEFEFINID